MSQPVQTTDDYTAAADPATPLPRLASLAAKHPDLQETIARNPACYPGLLSWLAQFGTPEARAAAAEYGYAAANAAQVPDLAPSTSTTEAWYGSGTQPAVHAAMATGPAVELGPHTVATRGLSGPWAVTLPGSVPVGGSARPRPGYGWDIWLWLTAVVSIALMHWYVLWGNPALAAIVTVLCIAAQIAAFVRAIIRRPRSVLSVVLAILWAIGAVVCLAIAVHLYAQWSYPAFSTEWLLNVPAALGVWWPLARWTTTAAASRAIMLAWPVIMLLVSIVQWAVHQSSRGDVARVGGPTPNGPAEPNGVSAGSRVQPAVWAPMSGMAVASFVLGLLGGSVVGLVLGIVALNQTQRTGERGRGLAIAGVVLSSLWIVAAIVYVVVVIGVLSSLSYY